MSVVRFNVRVYILLFDENHKRILLSDEIVDGNFITKFPGGGLEYGEGILDCLHREAGEELGQEVEVIRQYYTSERFMQSLFRPEDHIICVYYQCLFARDNDGHRQPKCRVTDKKFDFTEKCERAESLRWAAIANLQPEDLSLPLDREIVARLVEQQIGVK